MPSPIDPFEQREPIDGASYVDPDKKFCAGCLTAIREFRSSKPWRGTIDERQEKFRALHATLCETYGLTPAPPLEFMAIGEARPDQFGTGGFDPENNRVVVAGRLSVTTYLWSIARARGLAPQEAFRWSLSLFARMFPRSFAGCHFVGPMLVRDGNENL